MVQTKTARPVRHAHQPIDVDFARRERTSHRKPESGKTYARRRLGALALSVGILFGAGKLVYKGGEYVVGRLKGPEVPELDAKYTARPNDTLAGIAEASMPGQDYRGLQDVLEDESAKDGMPGLQQGEHLKVPHQFIDAQKPQNRSQG